MEILTSASPFSRLAWPKQGFPLWTLVPRMGYLLQDLDLDLAKFREDGLDIRMQNKRLPQSIEIDGDNQLAMKG